jgi:hypothetical protein
MTIFITTKLMLVLSLYVQRSAVLTEAKPLAIRDRYRFEFTSWWHRKKDSMGGDLKK